MIFRCVLASLYEALSVRPSVGPSVRPSVRNALVKLGKNGFIRILNDLDNAGRGGRRDEEEVGTRRKEG